MRFWVAFGMAILHWFVPGPVVASTGSPDGPRAETSIVTEADREPLVDLLASDSIERVNFVATSFDGAMDRIELAVDLMFEVVVNRGVPVQEAGGILGEVIRALDGFNPRMDGYDFGRLTVVILDSDDARRLGELVGLSASLVESDPASRAAVQVSAKNLFRGVVIDTEEGIAPLEQLLDHVRSVDAAPPSDRGSFLR